MCKFVSSQEDESRVRSADSLKACSKHKAFNSIHDEGLNLKQWHGNGKIHNLAEFETNITQCFHQSE